LVIDYRLFQRLRWWSQRLRNCFRMKINVTISSMVPFVPHGCLSWNGRSLQRNLASRHYSLTTIHCPLIESQQFPSTVKRMRGSLEYRCIPTFKIILLLCLRVAIVWKKWGIKDSSSFQLKNQGARTDVQIFSLSLPLTVLSHLKLENGRNGQ
jgi:hypothetical protein